MEQKQHPLKIPLNELEQEAMKNVMTQEAVLTTMTQTFQREFERRAQAMQLDNDRLWKQLASKHGLDLRTAIYVPSPDGKFIVLKQAVYG